jgi:ribosome-binding factor A
MTRFKRADRVGGQVKKELSDLLRKEIRDPRLDSVTIVGVDLSDDLRSARVFFSAAQGEKARAGARAGFKSASGYLKRRLGSRLELKYVPELRFIYDESLDRATHLNEILKTISEETESAEDE